MYNIQETGDFDNYSNPDEKPIKAFETMHSQFSLNLKKYIG